MLDYAIINTAFMKKKILLASISGITAILAVTTCCVLLIGSSIANKNQSLNEYFTVYFDSNGGSELDPIKVRNGERVPKPNDPSKNGYYLKEWQYSGENWDFNNNYVTGDMTLFANWDLATYHINFELNGGEFTTEYIDSFNLESSFDLTVPRKQRAIFVGWYDGNNNPIQSIEPGTYGDLTLEARWIDDVVVWSTDKTKGNVTAQIYNNDSTKVLLTNQPVDNKYHVFKCWMDKKNNVLSENESVVVDISVLSGNEIRSVYFDEEEEYEWNIEHGVIPSFIDEEHNHIKYGMYPLDNISDEKIVDVLNTLKPTRYYGYYYYNHEYYYKKRARLYHSGDTYLDIHNFNNGIEIIDGIDYWFKVSPLSWRVLETNNDEYLLLCDNTTETQYFAYDLDQYRPEETSIYANNYEHSFIRNWLNDNFLHRAFQFNESNIQTSFVDNSLETTMVEDEKYISNNTEDKVFLLSYADYNNEDYGFKTNNDRQVVSSDLFRATNGLYGVASNDLYCAYLLTRSPTSDDGYSVTKVNKLGILNNDGSHVLYCGVQPAITIKIAKQLETND